MYSCMYKIYFNKDLKVILGNKYINYSSILKSYICYYKIINMQLKE